MSQVYVIGAGIHPFGRHDGKSGLDLGVDATKLALNDCGLEWSNVEAAFGGSSASGRSEEHTSELQSLMRKSYAVFCLKKTKTHEVQPNKHRLIYIKYTYYKTK